MIDREMLRLSAVPLVVGFILYMLWAFSIPTDRPTTTERCLPYTPAAPDGQLYISANSLAWRCSSPNFSRSTSLSTSAP
jgi:hypothetical protein